MLLKPVIWEKGSFKNAFTLLEIMTVVCIVALLAALCIPTAMRARDTAQTKLCIDNLRVLDGAKQQWGIERKAAPAQVPRTDDLRPYLVHGTLRMPVCPADSLQNFDSSYSMNDMSTVPECLIAPAKHLYNP